MWTAARGQVGRFVPLVSCLLAVFPFFIVDGLPAAPLLAPWPAGVLVRWRFGDNELAIECAIFGITTAWLVRDELRYVFKGTLQEMDHDFVAGLWLLVSRFAIPLALLAQLWRLYAYNTKEEPKQSHESLTEWSLQYPKPRIFPCQTKHARLFPQRHAFEYSYLQVGFPIIPTGLTADGQELGGSSDSQLGSWWLRIHAKDYLGRGHGKLGFYGKLKQYLTEHQVDSSGWLYAYLVTAPRFFGYAFNPVSFWYIYDADHQLQKMILEVNNTFGERRMYLLDGSNVLSATSTVDFEASGPEMPPGSKSRFTDRWVKDFHVSPFNSRKGSYVLKALNPFPSVTYDSPAIDNTITLISSKDHAKLVARLKSTAPAIEMDHLSSLDAMRIILSWWWVGFVTFPRIVKEAFKLFFNRKLQVWFRPEVLHSSIGRIPTSTEIELYHVFRDYLIAAIHQSSTPFCITFNSAIPDEPVQKIETLQRLGRSGRVKELELHILSPAFYSRFVHYAHTSEAFDRECIFTDEKNRTLWVSRPELLPMLFNKARSPRVDPLFAANRMYLDKLRWDILRKLRCAPANPAYPISTPNKVEYTVKDVRCLPFSELDQYVLSIFDAECAAKYRKTVTKLFMAQRFGLGFAETIGLLDALIRSLLCGLAAFQLAALRNRTEQGIAGCTTKMNRDGTWAACSIGVSELHGDWWRLAGAAVSIFGCHLYGLSKGYN